MAIARESTIPTYSGGLGVLAGDMLRAAADLGFPMVAITSAEQKRLFSTGPDRHWRTDRIR